MRGWSGCASQAMGMSAAGVHPRVLAMATNAIGATLPRQCGSCGGINFRSTSSQLRIQRIPFLSVQHRLGTARFPGVCKLGFGNVRCEAEKKTHLERTEKREDVSWLLFKESTLQRAAGVFLGCALLVASLGLGLPKSSLARAPAPPSTSSTLQNEEADVAEDAEEGELEPAKKKKDEVEEEEDPAELVLLSYLKRHPKDEKTLEGLLYVRLRKGNVSKALETVDGLLALRPDHAPWLLIKAQSLEFLGDLEAARAAFERILEQDPLSARALQGLATVMAKAGEGTEMLEMLRRAVQSAVDVGKTKEAKNLRMLLGQMYTLQGNLQEALATYQELEKEDPRDFRPYLCQGLVYSLLDQKQDAERAFLKYRRRCPKTFPKRGYLDDLMLGAKTEARKQQMEERLATPAKNKGNKKKPKPLQQPHIQTAFSENPDGEQDEPEQEE